MSDLILYQCAKDALAECKFVDEVKNWVDRAAATQAYARMAKDKGLEVDAAEIRIRAERRLGEMLAEQKASGGMSEGGRPKTGTQSEPVSKPPTLAEVGIDKKLSARAQKTAAIPAPEFEGIVEEWRGRVSQEGERVTAKLEAAGRRAKPDDEDEGDAPEDDDTSAADALADMATELEAARKVLESDDKLAEAWAEVKLMAAQRDEARELLAQTRRQCASLQAELQRIGRQRDALQKKLSKLEAA